MSIRIHASRFASRYSFLQLAIVALAGFFCSSMMAQTAPQLLPYSVKVIAGGGTTVLPLTVGPGACTPSGNTPTTIWGDGCLATDLVLAGPRSAVTDAYGNVFFTDYQTAATGADLTTGLIRRVDAVTGVVTTVAGGVLPYTASPGTGAACATGSSATATDAKGDGCLGTQVYLGFPIGLVFSPTGDLYFSEIGSSTTTTNWPAAAKAIFGADVRKIAATHVAEGTGGCTLAAGCQLIIASGAVSMVDGALSSYTSYGYTANNYSASPACSDSNLTNCIVAATQSYLDAPYSLSFDNSGNLYIAEEGKQAVLVVNTSANTNKLFSGDPANEVDIPAGTVAKIVGATTAGSSTCPNSPASPNGCNYPATGGTYTLGASANLSMIDAPYGVTVDSSGNVYFSDEYLYNVPKVVGSGATSGSIYLYAGIQDTEVSPHPVVPPVTTRGVAGSFAIGNPHGVAADSNNNVYIADGVNGLIWRVDSAGQYMYPVAGGAATVCTASIVPGVTTIDSYGDGCPATSAKFGVSTGTTGVFGVSADAYSNLFVGDTIVPLVREVTSGTQFAPIADTPVSSANQATQYVKIHFAAGDGPISPATDAYQLTSGAANFSLGTAVCTTNSDTTEDCVLPITAAPTVLGAFTGTLQVTATVGGAASFPLTGTFVQSPQTRTVVSASQAASCTNNTAYSNATPVTLTATITSSGAPSGTVIFYANGTQIGTEQTVFDNAATLTYTFSTAGSYAITATYSGDSFYETSTSLPLNITSAVPSLGTTAVTSQLNTVNAGQTALYSFSLAQNVYSGTITFTCSGLPAGSSCVFSPASISAGGCQTSSTITMSILTQGSSQVMQPASLGGAGRGPWQALGILCSIGLALLIGIRRRQVSLRYGQIWLALALILTAAGIVSCNGISLKTSPTPAGTYTVSVTANGSGGTTSSFTVPLTVK